MEKMENLISVIVPVYNVEKYLHKCIDSIINQTYRNLEIILIDDGSTDSSGVICDSYELVDNRITVIHQENKGLSAARNAGLRIANGDWISFIDSDDWIDIDMYQIMIQHCTNEELILCKFMKVYENDKINIHKEKINIHIFKGRELLSAYLRGTKKYVITPAVWDRLYKKELLSQIEFPEGRLSEDILFTIKVFYGCKKALYIDMPLYFYRINRMGGISYSGYQRNRIEDKVILSRQAIDFLGDKDPEMAQLISENLYIWLFDMCLKVEDKTTKKYVDNCFDVQKTCLRDIKILKKNWLKMQCIKRKIIWTIKNLKRHNYKIISIK